MEGKKIRTRQTTCAGREVKLYSFDGHLWSSNKEDLQTATDMAKARATPGFYRWGNMWGTTQVKSHATPKE